MGLNNPAFCEKWCEITTNAHLIKEISEQLTVVCGETTRESFEKTIVDEDKLKDINAECEQLQKQLEIKQVNKKKFHKDEDDYKLQGVFTWRSVHSWRHSSRRSESEPLTSGNDTDSEYCSCFLAQQGAVLIPFWNKHHEEKESLQMG